ncbi:uncharacterized protein LOC131005195 [Salvia miltiorrhiza]|uniref:uncharacterized protein LOC131005195 n=1 Tax=Salvia miltiorrhiza TaxID=226208 RepID=UPI0025ACA1DD|nr:uncharacterized protein LOC131005195 [Salvia miltiorrhiza]
MIGFPHLLCPFLVHLKIEAMILTAPQIAPTIQTLSPNLLPIFHTLRFGPTPTRPRRALRIACSKETETPSEELLAAEFGLQIKRLNSEIAQREDAFRKSKELLFAEMSEFVGLKSEDLTNKWRRMDDDEKWVLVRGFVAEWSAHFHPLSARSVKELVEEYVAGIHEFSDSASGNFFSDFTKLFGFHSDDSQG